MINVDGTFNKKGLIEHMVKVNIYYQGYRKKTEINVIGEQKWNVILEILWLACHNLEIDWKTEEVKMMRCLEKLETKIGKIGIGKTKKGRKERERREEKRRERTKKKRKEETKEGEDNRSKESSREVGDLGQRRSSKVRRESKKAGTRNISQVDLCL